MLASIKWLNDYVEINEPAGKLADALTMAGVPVASVSYLGENIDKVITGRLLEVSPHPDADRLSVCRVDLGNEEVIIVTGAANVQAGQVVPVALPGCKLPVGKEIGTSVFRGVMSHGMLCSAEELGLDSKVVPPELRDGIYILPSDTPIGVDIKPVMGLDDTVLEFELTPNRADCFSIIGLAREVAVLTAKSIKKPILSLRETGSGHAGSMATISIKEPALCSRFAARILQNVTIGPSPLWMQQRLQAAGMRPINNVVDVTNFVMLEMGQPMHAYDYNLLAKHSISVRKAHPGERITTLDGVKRELTADMLVIADAVQAVGIAGVMGGLATEVTPQTQTVLLEAASFQGTSVRRTSRALGLRSEASSRFERGVDTASVSQALDRAAKLLEDMGACKVCPDSIDNYPAVSLPAQISFTAKQLNRFLGTDIPEKTMIDILQRLEFSVNRQGDNITVTVPSWRHDVTGPADISEEVARIYGYDKVPVTTPSGRMTRGSQSYLQTIADRIKTVLCGLGFNEMISFSFIHPTTLTKLNISSDHRLAQGIEIKNPITDDYPWLRTTLTGGVLDAIVRNISFKNEDLRLFELGAVYLPKELPLTDLPDEPLMLCGAMVGRRQEVSWNQPSSVIDFYDAKGSVEILLASLGINDYVVEAGEHYALHPGKTAVFIKDGQQLAVVGEVHPRSLDAFGLTKKVYLFEVSIAVLASQAKLIGAYRHLPKFPAITRDLAVVIDAEIPSAAIEAVICANGGDLLAETKLFDVYTGEQVPAGCRSLAYSLVFRAPDRTLTDAEVDGYFDAVVSSLEKNVQARIRA